MKTGKTLERNAWFLAKVDLRGWKERLIWWAFRKYLLNEDHWRLRMMFTGPRPRGTSPDATIKANATHRRMYLVPRHPEPRPSEFVKQLLEESQHCRKFHMVDQA